MGRHTCWGGVSGLALRGITGQEIVFGYDRNAQLASLLVLARRAVDVVVNQEAGRFRHAARHFAALTLYVGLELIAVLVMMNVARYHKSQPVAQLARGGC